MDAAPRVKRERVEVVEVPKASIVAAMPKAVKADGANPSPVHYNGGVIYTVWNRRKFRALTTRGDNYREKL